MATSGKMVIVLNDNGTIKINSRGLKGSEKELLAELNELAALVGGALVVEGHAPGTPHHHQHDGEDHVHSH